MTKCPIALTIAGSDSSGGAGIQADLKTFAALGVYGASVITALTAQNTLGVSAIHTVPARFVREQMDAVFSDLEVRAVKIGMLSEASVIEAVAQGLSHWAPRHIVLDPVMVSASGSPLLEQDAVSALRDRLFPLADVITPNIPEAAVLLNSREASTEEEMLAQGRALLAQGAKAVLLKGGHSAGEESVDLLVTPEGHSRYASLRITTRHTHGTGCTLSSAIAAGLAQGLALHDSVQRAKHYISGAIMAAETMDIGKGHGPVDHFWQVKAHD